MYIPAAFDVSDQVALFAFAERHSFATLVTTHGDGPFATHLPLLLDRDVGAKGTIVGHVARANPQWRDAAGQTALVIYQGAHAYVSPTWYAEPNTVPTWNYEAVHAYGTLTLMEDPAELTALVARMVDVYERSMPEPWKFDSAAPMVAGLVKQIVGFRIEVERWEGKSKLNQNHSQERRERVIAALEQLAGEDEQAIAARMRSHLGSELS